MGTCCFTVPSDEVAVIEKLGKFSHFGNPGFNCLVPCLYNKAGAVSTRIQQLNVGCETKTVDDVFVHITVSIQYQILRDKIYEAYYRLMDSNAQINSYVYDTIRATIPRMKLDDVFASKDEIAVNVKRSLDQKMSLYGYNILQTLVTDINPNDKVKNAMNEIDASRRMRKATTEKAEADKIMIVKKAQAEAESKRLSGEGIARQRKAIVDGLRDSVTNFKEAVPGSDATDVMELVLITQYFDTLKDVSSTTSNRSIFVPHAPSALGDIAKQLKGGFMR